MKLMSKTIAKDTMSNHAVRQNSYWLVIFTKGRLWKLSDGLCVKTETNADRTDTAVIFMVIVFVTVSLHLYDIQTFLQRGQQDGHGYLYRCQSFHYTDKHTDTGMSEQDRTPWNVCVLNTNITDCPLSPPSITKVCFIIQKNKPN